MKIVSWNCNFFKATDNNKYQVLDKLLKENDVICIQEPTTEACYKTLAKSSLETFLNAVDECTKNSGVKYDRFSNRLIA